MTTLRPIDLLIARDYKDRKRAAPEHLFGNVARENNFTSFEADVLGENTEIMGVFRAYGFHVESELSGGVYHITFPIAKTKRVVKKEEERERIATVASVRSLLYPCSVAVIGAST